MLVEEPHEAVGLAEKALVRVVLVKKFRYPAEDELNKIMEYTASKLVQYLGSYAMEVDIV